MHTSNLPWLSLLMLLLLTGAGLTALAPARKARWVALLTALTALAVTLLIVIGFDSELSGFQFVESKPWIPTLNIHYLLGVDGISLLFLPATSLLFLLVILASWNAIHSLSKLYFALLLLFQAVVIGIFTSLDTVLFFLFWELSLVPLYFLITLWGQGPNRRYAGTKYVLFMMTGGLPLLLAFVILAIQPDGSYIFNYPGLISVIGENRYQTAVFFMLLIGFGVKTPLVPMHTWLPVLALEGHPATLATIVGLKLGAYGILRFVLPLLPETALSYQWLLAGLGIAGVIYGAVAALSQTNLRRLLAYASLSHVGLVVVGLATFTSQGLQGAVFQLLNFTLIASGLFLLTGFLQQRVGSTDIVSLGGVAKSMPLLTSFFLFLGLASMGIPGTSGFPAELLIILSAFKAYIGVGLATLVAMVLGAAYFLNTYRRAFLGPADREAVIDAVDLKNRELLMMVLISLLVLVFGFYPQAILDIIASAESNWRIIVPTGM
ncbi:MAG TPA: NADH-quinone oxidoreductase subunit M [Chromatiales bacterium]|nr:NADH-quinone oxidoreductase subunit M [Thiotrichales bacterium]HIP68419.1 NADH-quinone oxidoreductase subunit M [Chromatiales bacterium]